MSASPDGSDQWKQRVRRLEEKVESLQATVHALEQRLEDTDAAAETDGVSPATEDAPSAGAPGVLDRIRRRARAIVDVGGEEWLGRVGIGLLLFGLVFLFNYAVEAGWLVPSVRVGFGFILGAVLLAGGFRRAGTWSRLAALLLGGSSAAWYASGFAAYQLYGLLAYPYAFAAMATVTAWTFVLAVRQDDALLAVVAVAGGLGTPFLLASDAGSAGGFVVYVALVIAGGALLIVQRGWRSLLAVTFLGGWAALLAGGLLLSTETTSSRWAVQIGFAYGWLVLGGVPVARVVLHERPDSPSDRGRAAAWLRRQLERRPPYVFVNAAPLLALAGSRFLWDGVADAAWGAVALVGGLAYAGIARLLYTRAQARYAAAHAIAAAVLAALGASEIADGSTVLLVLAVEAAVLILIGTRIGDASLRRSGHVLTLLVAVWWGSRIATPEPEAVRLVSRAALSELVVLGIFGGLSLRIDGPRLRILYRVMVHAGWLAWVWNELVPLANGQAYVSGVWALTAVALLLAGTARRVQGLLVAGLATLGLFVGKLFLVDLSALPALWRIALFLASGGLFVLLSYSLPGLRDPEA
jgi:uncharacterized membrane protein